MAMSIGQMGQAVQDWRSFAIGKKDELYRAVQDKYDTIEEQSKNDEEAATELGMTHIGLKGMMKSGKEAILKLKNLSGKVKKVVKSGKNFIENNIKGDDKPATFETEMDERYTSPDVIEEQQQTLGRGNIEMTEMPSSSETPSTAIDPL